MVQVAGNDPRKDDGLLFQRRVIPPSTTTSSPVMKDASSDARKSTTRAISSGEASRLWGILAATPVRGCRCVGGKGLLDSESVGPGLMAFSRQTLLHQLGGRSRAQGRSAAFTGVGARPRHSEVRIDRSVEDDGACMPRAHLAVTEPHDSTSDPRKHKPGFVPEARQGTGRGRGRGQVQGQPSPVKHRRRAGDARVARELNPRSLEGPALAAA